MELLEIIAAFTLSLGFVLLLWAVKGWLLWFPAPGRQLRLTVVVRARPGAGRLEHEITALRRLRRDGWLEADVLIVDLGMDGETAHMAKLLARDDPALAVCTPEELAGHISS